MSLTVDARADASLSAEVERLRLLAPDTRALYREVAGMLFFRFGIAPTANRLYQLVGKGSMATAASVLAKFWQDLREHGRLRLDHPGVPEQVRDLAGDLIGQLWRTAHEQAQNDLAGAQSEFRQEAESARADLALARRAAGEAEARTAELEQAMEALELKITRRDALLVERERETSQLRVEMGMLRASVAARQDDVEKARQAFAADIETIRAAVALTEERARGSERRALSEIEATRRAAAGTAKAFDAERKSLEAECKRLKKLTSKREDEIEALRERLVRAEAAFKLASNHLKDEQAKFSKLLSKIRPGSVEGPVAARRQRKRVPA